LGKIKLVRVVGGDMRHQLPALFAISPPTTRAVRDAPAERVR
jgi:hypothetical protein